MIANEIDRHDDLARLRVRRHVAVPDRRQRGDRVVEGVDERPAVGGARVGARGQAAVRRPAASLTQHSQQTDARRRRRASPTPRGTSPARVHRVLDRAEDLAEHHEEQARRDGGEHREGILSLGRFFRGGGMPGWWPAGAGATAGAGPELGAAAGGGDGGGDGGSVSRSSRSSACIPPSCVAACVNAARPALQLSISSPRRGRRRPPPLPPSEGVVPRAWRTISPATCASCSTTSIFFTNRFRARSRNLEKRGRCSSAAAAAGA